MLRLCSPAMAGFTSLSGEICLTCGRKTAPCMATCAVIRQKSAAAIVCAWQQAFQVG